MFFLEWAIILTVFSRKRLGVILNILFILLLFLNVLLYILNFYINKGIIIYNQKNKLFKEILVQIKRMSKVVGINV